MSAVITPDANATTKHVTATTIYASTSLAKFQKVPNPTPLLSYFHLISKGSFSQTHRTIPLKPLRPILRILRIIHPERNELQPAVPVRRHRPWYLAHRVFGRVFCEIGIGAEGAVGEVDVEIWVADRWFVAVAGGAGWGWGWADTGAVVSGASGRRLVEACGVGEGVWGGFYGDEAFGCVRHCWW